MPRIGEMVVNPKILDAPAGPQGFRRLLKIPVHVDQHIDASRRLVQRDGAARAVAQRHDGVVGAHDAGAEADRAGEGRRRCLVVGVEEQRSRH